MGRRANFTPWLRMRFGGNLCSFYEQQLPHTDKRQKNTNRTPRKKISRSIPSVPQVGAVDKKMKFLRRAVEDDKNIQLVTILRTAPNKLYRQGTKDKDELRFTVTWEE